jgi:predicted transcriptional regulator
MPAKISQDARSEIVKLRALDYDKTQIAEEVGITRQTVSNHLQDIRKEAESEDNPERVLQRYIGSSDVEDRILKLEKKVDQLDSSA